jgi:two-component system cell cycle sensor histidine kinase/response regulator CckA
VTAVRELTRRLAEAEATIRALVAGQVDAVVDAQSKTPVLLSKAQEALRLSEEHYRSIVETAGEGIWAIDENAKTTFVNAQLARMLGYSADEMIGMPVIDIVSEADRGRAEQALEREREGKAVREDSVLRCKDGTQIWVRVSATPIFDAQGKHSGGLAMVTDRTQYRVAEEALRRSEEQYRQIVETTHDGIIACDQAALIVFVNRRFAELLGYEPREMVGRSLRDFMSGTGSREPGRSLAPSDAGAKRSRDGTCRHKDGTEVAVDIAESPVVDAKGRHVGTLTVVRDITESRKLQAQLMASDRMASMGTMAAGVAHEINNPLAALMGNLDCIAESLRDLSESNEPRESAEDRKAWLLKELKSPLDDARSAAERVRSIVRDLKMLTRSPSEDSASKVDIETLMESSLRMASNEIRHRARLVKNYGRVPFVRANEARLGQVFMNLIVNAAQAMEEGNAQHNELSVRTTVDGACVVIEVTDTGSGIPPENIPRVFDAFFTTKAVGIGTGLGLAICHRIVTDMAGELTVESTVGVGTTFRVSIPITLDGEVAIVATAQPPQASLRGQMLVVDDEEMVLRAMKRILSKEHDVVTTSSGNVALALCAGGRSFDLILCDLMMPSMTGMELHHELSRIAPEQAERMIFLTGGAFTKQAREFLSDSTREHIEKPFDAANLRAIVQHRLRLIARTDVAC